MSKNGGRSDIFESFVKIALKEGLISEADEPEHTEKSFHETNPRHDSLSIEQIGKLYNTKPSSPKEMEYKKNIMETAHPESLVISPSYDKLNGLIENEIEGQNIRLHIVNKEPDGHLTQRKYAEKQLLLSLVRVANDLDNRDQVELRKLADVCLVQASGKQFRKVAIGPAAIIAGVAAAVGILYAKQHLRFHSDGWSADYQKAIKEIDDLLQSSSSWQTTLGAGQTYTPAFLQIVTRLKTLLGQMNAGIQKLLPILNDIETPHVRSELVQLSTQPKVQEATQALADFENLVKEINPYIQTTIRDFGNEGFKQRAIAEKGVFESAIDSTEILHGGKGLIADDFDDVAHALGALYVDIQNVTSSLNGAKNKQETIIKELSESDAAVEALIKPPETATPAPAATATTPAPAAPSEVSSLEEKLKQLLHPGTK